MTGSAAHSQRATIYSVAAAAGVSIATVSRVFQGTSIVAQGTRERVLAAADELNYVPLGAARSLAVSRHELLGLVLPELGGPYYSELLMGFESRASELGLGVIVVVTQGKPDPSRAIRQLMSRVDAIAVLGSDLDDDALTHLATVKPLLSLAGIPDGPIDSLAAENTASAEQLTIHLLDHGRSSLLFLGDPDAGADIAGRYTGFSAALSARGLDVPEPVRIGLRESDGAAFATAHLAGEHRADALVCANDELALAVLAHLQDHGVDVPADVAVVGWDDVMAARYVRPALTTVRQPVRDLGALASDRLHAHLNGTTDAGAASPTHDILPTQVVIRSSCGCTTSPPERHLP
ncbi:transcriptional regulator, LacI family protein [Janibacter sp. HTCC2649]|uniref:LacI family DNA-binding transcriptional regulator n=1 Tax=Janibacter sp. HTCC2649 TaxID=313589 RepID=UPI0000670BB2|nr:LacI family DNA-binding transcriptional regulator [Janibacter sp. HTCC2649]EAQ00266.1 transcriptional regulator, LacI family protein [Janibacter sp. HTCC2649]